LKQRKTDQNVNGTEGFTSCTASCSKYLGKLC